MKATRTIVQTTKHRRIHRSTVDNLSILAQRHNVVVKGRIEYYGKFLYRSFSFRLWSAMQSRRLTWMKAKYRGESAEAIKVTPSDNAQTCSIGERPTELSTRCIDSLKPRLLEDLVRQLAYGSAIGDACKPPVDGVDVAMSFSLGLA